MDFIEGIFIQLWIVIIIIKLISVKILKIHLKGENECSFSL